MTIKFKIITHLVSQGSTITAVKKINCLACAAVYNVTNTHSATMTVIPVNQTFHFKSCPTLIEVLPENFPFGT